MNCQISAWVLTEDSGARQALLEVQRWMQRVERELSRFRPDSDLSRLNAAAGKPYRAGELLWQVTTAALDAARATDGLFDPTVGRALIQAGYDRSFERIAGRDLKDAPLAPPRLPAAAWRDIHLDPNRRTITLPEGVQLDLGGVAC